MENPHQREVAVFEAALQLPPGQRLAYLDQTCGDDPELRRRIQALLKAHESEADFPSPAASVAGPTIVLSAPPTEKPGDRIGRYKLLQQIGEGGCGVVYMAEQEEPIRRRVALKIIKLGMDTKQVIARFEAERQALALMDHPNIAKIYDAGVTGSPHPVSDHPLPVGRGEGRGEGQFLSAGRPYFVMELVRGVKITDYCDQNNLSMQERLDLFIQVCHAVQHAHQKGIIHRDLKPSNILVTVNDGVAVPKVIDFGIAKATQGRLTDQTVFTAFEQFIGTPAYMSPEQAVLTSLDVDTRSDIYSLGVLLYELLTGKTPFDQKELLAAGLDEMRRTIREKEPSKPSTRLTEELVSESEIGNRQSEMGGASSRRLLQLKETIHFVRGDLDWIVMKCLEKDRARRYETANGLAMDIQRHLHCEPVIARPPSRWYEFQKTVRRHKVGFAATAVVIVCLMLGLGGAIWGFQNERNAHRQAEAARAKDQILLQRAQASVTISKARDLYLQGEWQQAEKLLNDIPPLGIVADPAHAGLRRGSAWYRAMQQEWDASVSNLAILSRLNVLDVEGDKIVDLCWLTEVTAQQDNHADYEVHRQAMIAAFLQTTNQGEAVTVCTACLLLPADDQTMKRMRPLFDLVCGEEAHPTRSAGNRFFYFLAEAMVDYRCGEFEKAVEDSRKALAQAPALAQPNAKASAILALSFHQLHREAEARAALAQARKANNNEGALRYTAVSTSRGVDCWHLFVGLSAQVLIREAAVLIEGAPNPQDQGYTAAEFAVGRLYALGWNADESTIKPSEAVKWYRKAADAGRGDAAHLLGGMYRRGDGVPKDAAEAIKWFLKAAEEGESSVQITLGQMYQVGEGVPKDAAAAAQWFLKAAEGGNSDAQRQLVRIYKEGDGVPKDDAESLKWQRKVDELFDQQVAAVMQNIADKKGDAVGLRIKLGDLLVSHSKLTEARVAYTEAIQLNPESAEAWAARGHSYLLEAWSSMVNSSLSMNDFTNMANDYSEAIRLKPEFRFYWHERAYAYQQLGDFRRSITDHSKTIELGDYDADERMRRGQAFEVLGELPAAGADYSRAIELNPSYWGNWNDRARIDSLLHQSDKARADLAEAVKRCPSGNVDDQNKLAWELATSTNSTLRDGPAAVKLAEQAVASTRRTNGEILDTLAAAYAETGQFTNAVSIEKESIGLLTNKVEITDYTSRLKLYESNTPYREP